MQNAKVITSPFLELLVRRIHTIEGNVSKLEKIDRKSEAFKSLLNLVNTTACKVSKSLIDEEEREGCSSFIIKLRNTLTSLIVVTQALKKFLDKCKKAILKDLLVQLKNAVQKSKEIAVQAISACVQKSELAVDSKGRNLDAIVKTALGSSQCKNVSYVKCDCFATPIRRNVSDIARVFINVFNNSVEAISKKRFVDEEPCITVTSGITVKDKCLLVTVKDNGIGMTSDVFTRVFEEDFSTKDVSHGTGLHNLKNTIEQIGGSIDIKSVYGQGTTVIIGIPLI